MSDEYFRTAAGRHWFESKYAQFNGETWLERAVAIVDDVAGTRGGTCSPLLSKDELGQMVQYILHMKYIPAGRYIYYAGRPAKFFNNCYLLRAEHDTREEWGRLGQASFSALMCGGGIGIDYSRLRPANSIIRRTGGVASGPLPLAYSINEIGRNVMQGGARRSAIYGSINWQHPDASKFLVAKDWSSMVVAPGVSITDAKAFNQDYPAPLDMTNISLNWDDDWLEMDDREKHHLWIANVMQACATSEPGFSFNFGIYANETLRNACTEVTSEDDSDCCNLGSVNMANIETIEEMRDVTHLGAKFQICGSMRADVPYQKVAEVREKNRRIGVGLMGVHEWLLKRGYKYEYNEEFRSWLDVWEEETESAANEHCDRFYISRPRGYRAIAPTGTIGGLAGTTTGVEPLFAVAYKRRYVSDGNKWKYEYVVDGTAQTLIDRYGYHPDDIETALSLAMDPERRIRFQAHVQQHVDHAISSTINLPAWGTEHNNPDTAKHLAKILSDYAPQLRGFTCYADGSRGGQPLTVVDYKTASKEEGVVYEETDICSLTGKGGVCGS